MVTLSFGWFVSGKLNPEQFFNVKTATLMVYAADTDNNPQYLLAAQRIDVAADNKGPIEFKTFLPEKDADFQADNIVFQVYHGDWSEVVTWHGIHNVHERRAYYDRAMVAFQKAMTGNSLLISAVSQPYSLKNALGFTEDVLEYLSEAQLEAWTKSMTLPRTFDVRVASQNRRSDQDSTRRDRGTDQGRAATPEAQDPKSDGNMGLPTRLVPDSMTGEDNGEEPPVEAGSESQFPSSEEEDNVPSTQPGDDVVTVNPPDSSSDASVPKARSVGGCSLLLKR